MALAVLFSPEFVDNLESILTYYDERNGNDTYSKKLFKMLHEQIRLLSVFPEIGRITDFPGVRVVSVEKFGVEYQIREDAILVVDIYSCLTDPEKRRFNRI